jgi:dienelactone hydrolase
MSSSATTRIWTSLFLAALILIRTPAALAGPVPSLVPSTLNFGNVRPGTISPPLSATLTNVGDAPLTITSMVWNDIAGFSAYQSGTCASNVGYAPGASCTIAVEFQASSSASGPQSGSIVVSFVGAASVTLQLSANVSESPNNILSPSTLTFAGQPLGTSSAAQPLTLTNYGAVTLHINSVAFSGADASDFAKTQTCGSSLVPGASCTISVTFKPTQLGSRTATLSVSDDYPGSPQNVSLTGTGSSDAFLSSSTLTFAPQLMGTSSAAQSLTLTNYGAVTLRISSLGFSGADPGDFTKTQTCGSSLAPGASCTISITFKPTQVGSRTAILSISDNFAGSPQNVSLTGTGTVVALNPATLGFGKVQVGHSSNLSTTVINTGSTTLNFTGIATTGSDTDEFSQTNTCGSSLGAKKSCTITVTFRPREAGSDSAQISIGNNRGPLQVALSGAGCIYNLSQHKCVVALTSPAVRLGVAAQTMVAVPSPTGPSKVGTRVVDLVDSTRDDPFLAKGIKRELLVRFWYPAPAGEACKLADYTSPAVWARFSQLLAVPLPHVTTNSCLDAPITDEPHPVVVFTHGYTGTFTDYTFLYEDLASRGYVVASVDHTYEATAVEFPDGRLATSVLGSHLANNWSVDDETLQFVLSVRLDDLRFVLNQLQRINNEATGPFDSKLDMSRVALAGHSLGGLTALLGVRADSRFRAGILLDPYVPEDVSNPTLASILLLTAGRTEWSENELSLWSDLQGPRFAVNFRGAEHVMPSDAVWIAKGAIQTGDMGPDKTIAAIRNYIAAFLDANLRDQPLDPLLTGASSDYPDAEVTTQSNLLRGRP